MNVAEQILEEWAAWRRLGPIDEAVGAQDALQSLWKRCFPDVPVPNKLKLSVYWKAGD